MSMSLWTKVESEWIIGSSEGTTIGQRVFSDLWH